MKDSAATKVADAETQASHIKNLQHLRALYLAHVKEQLAKGKPKALAREHD